MARSPAVVLVEARMADVEAEKAGLAAGLGPDTGAAYR